MIYQIKFHPEKIKSETSCYFPFSCYTVKISEKYYSIFYIDENLEEVTIFSDSSLIKTLNKILILIQKKI